MNQGDYQRQIIYRLLLTSLWANLLLLAVEALGGWASQSLTLLAEALHTLVDGFSTVLSVVAVTSPQRQMGREVWGHGRAEVAGTLVLCAFLGFTGVSLGLIALGQLMAALKGNSQAIPVSIPPQVLWFTATMVILNVTFGLYSSYQARSLNSLALKLNTQHFLTDAWLSLVMVAILLRANWDSSADLVTSSLASPSKYVPLERERIKGELSLVDICDGGLASVGFNDRSMCTGASSWPSNVGGEDWLSQ